METVRKFITFNSPDLGQQEIEAVNTVLRSGWIGTGKVSSQFEEEFADYCGGGYALAVSSCTIGLQLALQALGIGKGHEVIVPAMTFAATLNAVLATKAWPVLADIDYNGFIDIDKANLEICTVTKAMIPVHYSGEIGGFKRLRKGMRVIEDCAHAFGSDLKRKGDIQVFSFYANKTITSGEGGMVLTKDKDVAKQIRIMSAQGLSDGAWARYGKGPIKSYEIEKVGLKGNMPDILAAVGLVQLKRWPEMKQKRLKVWSIYEKAFGFKSSGQSMLFYPLRVKNRDEVRVKLHSLGIGTGIHYKPLHLEPAYAFLGYSEGEFPVAEEFGKQEISLPVSSVMNEADAEHVVNSIKDLKCEL